MMATARKDHRRRRLLASLVVLAAVLLAVQAVLFAVGAVRGVQATPHAWLFRTFVRPRLAAPTEWEAPEPPRFAQAVGLAFALVGLVAFLAGATVLGQVAVGFAVGLARPRRWPDPVTPG